MEKLRISGESINQGLTRSQEKGFKLDTTSGEWVSKEQDRPTEAVDNNVQLMVKDTSNVLVIERLSLPEKDTKAFTVTLRYAIERAIQALYKL